MSGSRHAKFPAANHARPQDPLARRGELTVTVAGFLARSIWIAINLTLIPQVMLYYI